MVARFKFVFFQFNCPISVGLSQTCDGFSHWRSFLSSFYTRVFPYTTTTIVLQIFVIYTKFVRPHASLRIWYEYDVQRAQSYAYMNMTCMRTLQHVFVYDKKNCFYYYFSLRLIQTTFWAVYYTPSDKFVRVLALAIAPRRRDRVCAPALVIFVVVVEVVVITSPVHMIIRIPTTTRTRQTKTV